RALPIASSARQKSLRKQTKSLQRSERRKCAGPRVSTIAPILRAALARRHAVPNVAMQTPPTIRAFEPDDKVLCLCLPGVGFANLVGSVAGDLEVGGLESDVRPLECRAPKFLNRLPSRNDRRTRRQNLGIFSIEASHTGIILAGGGGSKVPNFQVDSLLIRV